MLKLIKIKKIKKQKEIFDKWIDFNNFDKSNTFRLYLILIFYVNKYKEYIN